MPVPIPDESALLTPRLCLRAIVDDDAADVWRIFSDADAMRYWHADAFADPAQSHAFVALARRERERRSGFWFGITWREHRGELLGLCKLGAIDWASARGEILYAIARPAWGRGIASEALGALIEHAIDHFGMRRLEADVDPANTASIRLLERQGFRREGLLRARWIVGGRASDAVLFGLLAHDARARGGDDANERAVPIRAFTTKDTEPVVALWRACGLVRPWNDPYRDIARKLAVQPEWFLVASADDAIVGTVMAGYDGHRGWANYLAVAPGYRAAGLGRSLMKTIERGLRDRGCPKLSVQVRIGNDAALGFYERLGFRRDQALSLGLRLIPDQPSNG